MPARFCEEVLQPLNQSGDEEGCHFENGVVRTPKGFKEAYKAYCEAAGAGSARRRNSAARACRPSSPWRWAKWRMSANQSLAMYPMLTAGAYGALIATGAPTG